MKKQELIDKAVEDLKGKFPSPLKQYDTLYWSNGGTYFGGDDASIHKIICSREEFTQRAKELGWLNGFKYGVEYPTNGKKPDLPDDVEIIYITDLEEYSLDNAGQYNWFNAVAFRIVDERYKPKLLEEFIVDDMTQAVLKNNGFLDNSWHERGELPPVGTQCEWKGLRGGKWVQCEVIDKYQDKEMVVFNTGEYRNCKFEILQLDSVEFRPLKTEREKFVDAGVNALKASGKWTHVSSVTATALEVLFDAGFRAPEDKQ